jgi:hypothetical protein
MEKEFSEMEVIIQTIDWLGQSLSLYKGSLAHVMYLVKKICKVTNECILI